MKEFNIEDFEDEFIGWFASLPLSFIQSMYQLWELNQLPDIQQVISGLHSGKFKVEPITPVPIRNTLPEGLPDKKKPITNYEIEKFQKHIHYNGLDGLKKPE